jgi:diaminopimelate decarboxylase/aspartate kinase
MFTRSLDDVQVTQLKSKLGKTFVGISTGMNALIRPALYDAYHHIVNLSRDEGLDGKSEPEYFSADVVGPICESGDVLGRDRAMPAETAEGDVVLISDAVSTARSFCFFRPWFS